MSEQMPLFPPSPMVVMWGLSLLTDLPAHTDLGTALIHGNPVILVVRDEEIADVPHMLKSACSGLVHVGAEWTQADLHKAIQEELDALLIRWRSRQVGETDGNS